MSLRLAFSNHPEEEGDKLSRNSQLEQRLRRRSGVLRGSMHREASHVEMLVVLVRAATPGTEKVGPLVICCHILNILLYSVPNTVTTIKAGWWCTPVSGAWEEVAERLEVQGHPGNGGASL